MIMAQLKAEYDDEELNAFAANPAIYDGLAQMAD